MPELRPAMEAPVTSRAPLGRLLACKGFTFIEMIVVFLLITLALGIVYPVGWRLTDRFERRLERATQQKEKKRLEFMAFIRDESNPEEEQH